MADATLKILVVEDNPMVLALLRQRLSELAPVSTASDGADALLKIVEDPPDLVITDLQMPAMDGQELLNKIKSRPATAHIPVIMVASRNDISEKLRGVQGLVEEFIEKPFFVDEALSRVKRVIDRISLQKLAKNASEDTILRGNLAQMNVIDLVQSLEMGRKSCMLTLANNADQCELFFKEGQIAHAVFGATKGDEAVYPALGWSTGSFQIDFSSQTAEQTTTRSTQSLLMEGLRLLDEANRDTAEAEV